MFLKKAMRYYRFWIYSCNLALLLGILLFVALAASVISDFRLAFLPSLHPHLPTLIYAYFAVAVQGGLLQFIGCFGAVRMSERLLHVYWVLLLVLLCGDVLTGIIWIFRYGSLTASLCGDLTAQLRLDYASGTADSGGRSQFRALWDRLQTDYECCGVHGPGDFNNLSVWGEDEDEDEELGSEPATILNRTFLFRGGFSPPVSCCLRKATMTNATCADVFPRGCCEVLRLWLERSADMLAVLGFCVIAFLKMCFLAILRYEIKEMIQKIQMLKETKAAPPLSAVVYPDAHFIPHTPPAFANCGGPDGASRVRMSSLAWAM